MTARSFLESVAGYTDAPEAVTPSQDKPPRLGVVDAGYTGSGAPMVLFDGESLMGVKTYPWVGRQPLAGERVVLLAQGRGYVILGTLGTSPDAVTLGDVNLDTVTRTGNYVQNTFTQGTLANNYPVTFAGTIHVISGEGHVTQALVERSGLRSWTRGRFNTTWGAWRQVAQRGFDGAPFGYAAGQLAGITLAANMTDKTTVTFPANRFTVAPVVVVGVLTDARDTVAYAEAVTASNFVLVRASNAAVSRPNLAATWHAAQMTATTAAG